MLPTESAVFSDGSLFKMAYQLAEQGSEFALWRGTPPASLRGMDLQYRGWWTR